MSDKKRGLGSSNFDPNLKKLIHSMGGKASKGGGRPKKVKTLQ